MEETRCIECGNNKNCCNTSCFTENETNIFKPLTEKELLFLVDKKQQIRYNIKETIIKQNTSSTFVICMREGLAKVFIEGDKGKNLIVKIIGKGDFISGGGLFNGNVQHFTISAITPVTCCLIDAGKLTNLFTENNKFAVELLRNHTKQNNYLLSKMVSLTQKYMPGRVAETLLYLKEEIYNTKKFKVDLSRQELAEMSNMTKESLVRILQQFKESNLIKTQGSEMEILDEAALNHISKIG
ncbi:MAG: FNR family transcriptional regulator [Prolixibacteraceae bacterium]|nr:MAG: FNR family transcriptional regulator [Prolixibacteraceae bacterium]